MRAVWTALEQCLTHIADQHTELAAQLRLHVVDSVTAFLKEKEPRRKEVFRRFIDLSLSR